MVQLLYLMLNLVLSRKQKLFGVKLLTTEFHVLFSLTRWINSEQTSYTPQVHLHDRLQANAHPIQLPIGAEDEFEGIIDLVTMEAFYYLDDLGTRTESREIPAEYKEQADEYRDKLIEAVAELDEDLMMKYLEGEELTEEEIKAAIRKGTCNVEFYPVLCGSAFKNKGVQLVLDAVLTIFLHH